MLPPVLLAKPCRFIGLSRTPSGMAKKAIAIIKGLTQEPEVGEYYMGVVRRIVDFGAFVEILPGTDGLIHVSELEHVPRESLGGRGGDALDRRAITAYRDRLAELAEELDDAEVAHDIGRAEKLRVEYDALVEQLSGSLGLGGRSRVAGPDDRLPVPRRRR